MDTVLEKGSLIEEPVGTHPLISWRSMIAGLLIALLCYMIFLTLGVAVGGVGLIDGVDSDARGVGLMVGAWAIVSAALSLFIGGYFAARVSKFAAPLVGSAQALVISSLFFGIIAFEIAMTAGMAAGLAGRALGGLAAAAGRGASDVVSSPVVMDAVDQSLEGLQLRSAPDVVAQGVAVRLIRGEPQAALNYLARQSGQSPAQLQSRIDTLQAQVQTALTDAGQNAARALAAAAWSLVATMVIGLLAAVAGGFLGARSNVTKPLSRTEPGFRRMRPATV